MNEPQSSNISASDLDEDTKKKLKGDTIGDTLYSESFVIKTLLNLSDLKWTEEVEQDLCFLWDMTVEKDVCKYLFDLNYPSIACSAIARYKEGRFIEIMIGILANIMVADCEKNISKTEIQIVTQQLNSEDSPMLLQIMRFFEAIAYTTPDKVALIGEEVIDKMEFILKYSEDFDLIFHTMQALVRLTEDFKVDYFTITNELYEAAIQGFDTIFTVEANNFEIEIDIEETRKVVKTFFKLVTNICAYVDKYNHDDGIPIGISNCRKLSVTICRMLRHFSEEQYLLPLTNDFNEYILAFQAIFTTRDVTIVSDLHNGLFYHIFYSLCKTFYLLHKCKSEVLESFNLVLELIGYLIYFVDQNTVLVELKKFRCGRAIVVLNALKENSKTFDFDISDKLRFLFSEFE